jgi:hypothetical protein
MSKFMLNDEDAINDVNPYVTHDFLPPGSMKRSGDFDNFANVSTGDVSVSDDNESVYCNFALCETQTKPAETFNMIHPRRNIDTGFVCNTPDKMKVGVANQIKIPYFGPFLIVVIIALVLLLARR